MTDTLLRAYAPLLGWIGLGALLGRWVPESVPRWLGRSLYWVGVPVEIFALARRTNFAEAVVVAPVAALGALLAGALLAIAALGLARILGERERAGDERPAARDREISDREIPKSSQTANAAIAAPEGDRESSPQENSPAVPWWRDRAAQGSYLLSSMLGNTGFVGLAVVPSFIAPEHLAVPVFYAVAQNVAGTYGIGVLLASYFGRGGGDRPWWIPLRDVLLVPSLWAFALGALAQPLPLPEPVESGLQSAVGVVIACAFLLMGLRLLRVRRWGNAIVALGPALLKTAVVPALVAIAATLAGLSASDRLALTLMSGMPTAFAGIILAEEYDLDRDIVATSIALSTLGLLVAIPAWLAWLG